MTIVMPGLKRYGHSWIDISPLLLLPLKLQGDVTSSLRKQLFFIPKERITICVCELYCPAGPSHLQHSSTNLDTKRKAMVIDGEHDDPLFSPFDHRLSLAAHDNAFQAKSA